MADPNLPPVESAPVVLSPSSTPTRNHRIVCEFCHCSLAPDGGVMAFSEEARALRDQKERITKLEGVLAQAEGAGEAFKREAETLRARVRELEGKPARRGWE